MGTASQSSTNLQASPAHQASATQQSAAAQQTVGPSWISGTASEPVPVTHGGRTYKVKQGDTLYAVASKHGVSVPALAELNRISPRQNLQQGQVLSLPEKNELPDTDPSHVVAPGETLTGIAARHGMSPGALRRANSMGDSSYIAVGELLLLRDSAARRRRQVPEAPTVLPRVAASAQTHAVNPDVLHAARLNKYTLLRRRHPAPAQARLLVAQIAVELGAEPELMQAVAAQESGFQHTTVSPGNAIGIMQVTPRSGRWASDIVGRALDLLDIADNIVAGTVILGWLIETAESETEALAGYYQDLRSVRADGVLPETKAFVRAVQLQRQRLKEAL
nr:LysM peptidoglycan-binding domain-containing protein [Brevibacterium sp.]